MMTTDNNLKMKNTMGKLGEQIVAGVKANLAGAKEAAGNYANAMISNMKTNKMQNELKEKKIVNQAQGAYSSKYGEKMLPSTLKGEMEGGIMSAKSKDYLKMKKEAAKKIK